MHVKLRKYKVPTLRFNDRQIDDTQVEMNSFLKLETPEKENTDGKYKCSLLFKAESSDESKKEDDRNMIYAVVLAEFEITESFDAQLFRKEAFNQLFPIMRHVVATLTFATETPGLFLPLMSYDDVKSNENKK